jgi:hypothetical protein
MAGGAVQLIFCGVGRADVVVVVLGAVVEVIVTVLGEDRVVEEGGTVVAAGLEVVVVDVCVTGGVVEEGVACPAQPATIKAAAINKMAINFWAFSIGF